MVDDTRAQWLARHIVPIEPALRAWLQKRRVAGLEIDDIVQESYARLAILPSVAEITNPRAYLYQAAHSIIVTYLRRQNVVSIQAVEQAELAAFGSDDATPEVVASDRDELFHLVELIGELPEQPRRVFISRRVEGLSQRETAQKLNLSESTVEKHMARAVRLFMDALANGGKTQGQASRLNQREKREGAND